MDVHRLTADWTELGATWQCAADADPSNAQPDCTPQWEGGAFVREATDSVLHTNGRTGWIPFDVTVDVWAFLTGTPHYGWLVKKADDGYNGSVEYTAHEGTSGQAPRLVLVVEHPGADAVPPTIEITPPSGALLVNEPTPTLGVSYADGGSGVDLTTLRIFLDEVELTPTCTIGPAAATCEAPTLTAGTHTVSVELRDLAGNLRTASTSFDLLLDPRLHRMTVPTQADTYLKHDGGNRNQGAEPVLRVRQSGANRTLVRFDPAELDAMVGDSTLVAATLEPFIEHNADNWGSVGRTVDIYRLTADWTEMGATWLCAHDTNPSNSDSDCDPQWAGGTFAPLATDSVLHTNGLDGWIRFDVTADVQAFLTGTPHYGWLLMKTEKVRSGMVEYTAREGTVGQEPRLVLVFETPDQDPPTLRITAPSARSSPLSRALA